MNGRNRSGDWLRPGALGPGTRPSFTSALELPWKAYIRVSPSHHPRFHLRLHLHGIPPVRGASAHEGMSIADFFGPLG